MDKTSLLKLGLPESDIVVESVPCCTFGTLMETHSVRIISLLVIDCEGFDFEVIKMCFATNLFPTAIYFESINLSKGDGEQCRVLLQEKGFELIETNMDTLAIQLQQAVHVG